MHQRALGMDVSSESLPLKSPFTISGHTFTHSGIVVVKVSRQAFEGRGEACGVYYRQDDCARMQADLESIRPQVEAGITRADLLRLLPPCGARNALDCALWDLEARETGVPAWEAAGLAKPRPLVTTFTLGADAPDAMAHAAQAFSEAKALKLKLTGDLALDEARVQKVRSARPDVWLGVDANQGYRPAGLCEIMGALTRCDVQLIEQPFPLDRDSDLDGFSSPIPIAADESVQGAADIERLVGRFDMINIKLDKCGGLTEALKMVRAARRCGLRVMVGNMVGSSLAMAPASLLGQLCDVVDLDGPLFLASDRPERVRYDGGLISAAGAGWGLM